MDLICQLEEANTVLSYLHHNCFHEAREVAQQLGVFVALPGARFQPQHPQGGSQLHGTPVLGYLVPFCGFVGLGHTQSTYMHVGKHLHT